MTYFPNMPSMEDVIALQDMAQKAMKAASDANDRATAANANAANANDRATAANDKAAAADTKATTANAEALTVKGELNTVNSKLATSVPWLGMQILAVPALSLGASTDIVVTWANPAPMDDYTVVTTIQGAGAVIGSLSVVVKPGTKTKTSVTITVKTSAILSINTAYIHVLAGRSANQ